MGGPRTVAIDTTRPFTFGAAVAAGVSRRQLAGSGYRRLLPGVYIAADMPVDARVWAQAAVLIAPDNAVVARHTAARLWGGLPPDDWRIHVTTLRRDERGTGHRELRRMRVDGVDARVSSDASRLALLGGLRVTDPVRTFLDLAEDLNLVELVVLGDSLVANAGVTPRALIEAAATPGRHRRLARRAAALVRAGVGSAQESRLRLLVVLAGMPEPQVDIQITDEKGRVRRRLDLGYERYLIGLEYEGRQHAESIEQWSVDIARREELDDLGWRLLLVVAKGIFREPETTLDRLVRLLRSRGCTDAAITSHEWRRYFGPTWRRSA